MWADRVTTKRTTGFSPYYLLYGKAPLFPFHITDGSWYTLDWMGVKTTEDLLVLRTKQLISVNHDRTIAADDNMKARVESADAHARKHSKRLQKELLLPGTFVLIHQLSYQVNKKFQGAKYRERWAGPYVVAKILPSGSYKIREIDGTLLKDSVSANRIKYFHTRKGVDQKLIAKLRDKVDVSELDEDLTRMAPGDTNYVLSSNVLVRKLNEKYGKRRSKFPRNHPNYLRTYAHKELDWEEIWERWTKRKQQRENVEKDNTYLSTHLPENN